MSVIQFIILLIGAGLIVSGIFLYGPILLLLGCMVLAVWGASLDI
jgi:hypothetical protein